MRKSTFAQVILVGFVFSLAVQSMPAQQPTINTVVGGGFYSLNKSATGFSVGNVTAVAVQVDSSGNLESIYVADSTHGSVYRIDTKTGVPTVVAGNGVPTSDAGNPTLGNSPVLAYPSGLAVDANGNLFVADSVLDVVFEVPTSGGAPQIVAGCGTPSNPACPVYVYPNIGDGGPAKIAALVGPSGVALDSAGDIFIAEYNSDRVREVCASSAGPCGGAGYITTVAGGGTGSGTVDLLGDGGPATNALLAGPSGVAVDSNGNLFIADMGGDRVREVCASSAGPCGGAGYITTVAGGGTGALSDYGPATSATLLNPQDVALDSNGNLYIADTGNNRVLLVDLGPSNVDIYDEVLIEHGEFQTIAGDGVPSYTGDGEPSLLTDVDVISGLNYPQAVAYGGGLLFIADSANFVARAINVSNASRYEGGNSFNIDEGYIATVVGNGAADFIPGGADPNGFQLGTPLAVSEDAASNIYVGEVPPRVIEAISSASTVTGVAGTGTQRNPDQGVVPGAALSAQLVYPAGLFLDSSDDVFIADGLGGLDKVDVLAAGSPTIQQEVGDITIPGYPAYGFPSVSYGIYGLTGENANSLYHSYSPANPYASNQSFVVTPYNASYGSYSPPSGSYPFTPAEIGDNGPATEALFSRITGLCSDADGNLFVADDGTFLVRIVNTSSTAITVAGVTVSPGFINTIAGGGGTLPNPLPSGLSLDQYNEHFYYTSEQLGDGGPATSALVTPAGCFVDNLGNIYIADEYNDRVRKVDGSTGNITTVAGGQYPGFSGDGNGASSASLNNPNAIWGDQAGNLLISDSGNHRIREIGGLLPVPGAVVSCENCDNLGNATGSSTQATITITNQPVESLANTGIAPLVMSTGPTLTDSTDFTISASTCPVGPPGLAPNASCTVTVKPTGTVPAGATEATANLVFYDNAYWSNTNGSSGPTPDPANLGQLSGYKQLEAATYTYTAPTANFAPLSLVFTAENVPQPITVQNTSSVSLTVSSVSMPVNGQFAQTNPPSTPPFNAPNPGCSTFGTQTNFNVPPKTNCNIYVVFNPSLGAAVTNPVIMIADNATTGTQTIPVSGYALVPAPPGATTFSISSSAPAPVNATFSLVGIPSGAGATPVCLIAPAGLDVNCTYNDSSQSITATVSIPSCVQTSKANVPAHRQGTRYLSIAVAAVILLLPWGRSSRRRLLALMTFALLFYLVSGLSACNSSKNTSQSCVVSVPAGTTFNLSVTANPTTAGQFPSLTLTAPDVINVTQ
jgi:sugar lactone lactonase YvrE